MPASPLTPKARQRELAVIHDFAAKLTQPSVIEQLRAYVAWQARARRARADGEPVDAIGVDVSRFAPLSINLDLTTACNYACDHCVDMDILNRGVRHEHDALLDSLTCLAQRGLRSVILIGGGEPTVYPGFADVVRHVKGLGLAVGLVTNGSRMDRVREVADVWTDRDWIRLSLDSGSDATFQAMHRPRRAISLDEICAAVREFKVINPVVAIGFSFIIVWRGCSANGAAIHDNLDEMVVAARLAKANGFDYISYKPFLTRAEANNAEVVGFADDGTVLATVTAQIRANIDEARVLCDDRFAVVESTNLRVFENGTHLDYTNQPRTCHMSYFRQVLSPLGVYHCPVYRGVEQARIGDRDAYATPDGGEAAVRRTLKVIESFDAAAECREVTCLYNHANWFIENLIETPHLRARLQPSAERFDAFL